jgi:chaperonin cofactor prefoldin
MKEQYQHRDRDITPLTRPTQDQDNNGRVESLEKQVEDLSKQLRQLRRDINNMQVVINSIKKQ